jgi:hypothetical protein
VRVRAAVSGGGSSGKGQGTDEVLCRAVLLVEWDPMEEREKLSMELLASVMTEITLTLATHPLHGRAGM